LKSGMYFIEVETNQGKSTKKIVVEWEAIFTHYVK
jgi:hypothetical protein